MNRSDHSLDENPVSVPVRPGERHDAKRRGFLGVDMPVWLTLAPVVLGLPRTVLADLGIVTPESSWVYYVLALGPFVVWLAVAVSRRTRTPFRAHLLTGTLYGLSLAATHEALWNAGSSQGHHPPRGAIELAAGYASPVRELIVHGYEFGIAMMIGLGVGIVAGIVATVAHRVRALRAR